MSSIECSLFREDSNRIIRFIDTHPVSVSNLNDEAINHDVERYCAYRQDAFHEQEALDVPSVGYLTKAREARVKILDSIDKYDITPFSVSEQYIEL